MIIYPTYWKQGVTYLLRSPSGNGIHIGLKIYIWPSIIQRMRQNRLDFFVGDLVVIWPKLDKRPSLPQTLEATLACWLEIEQRIAITSARISIWSNTMFPFDRNDGRRKGLQCWAGMRKSKHSDCFWLNSCSGVPGTTKSELATKVF